MYKTIVVHVDSDAQLPYRTRAAARIAVEFGAHLVGAAMTGTSRDDFLAAEGTVLLPPPDEDFSLLLEGARATLAPFGEQMRRRGVASWEERVIEDSPRNALVMQSRYADLLVLSHLHPAEARPRKASNLPEYLALHCPRPVLIVPDNHDSERIFDTVMIGWDGGTEATRAVTAALPLLRRARRTVVVVIDPRISTGRHGEDPGADIALYLARHGATVDVISKHHVDDVGMALLGVAAEVDAGVLVAGAYGHSRYREWFAGGTTRTLLRRAQLPLLLAH